MRLCWLPRPGDLLPWNSLENANGMSSLWRFNIFPGITFFCGHWPIDSWPHNILCVMVFLGHLKQSAVTSQQNEMKWNGMKEKVQQININIVIMKHWAKNEEEKPKSAAKRKYFFLSQRMWVCQDWNSNGWRRDRNGGGVWLWKWR